MEEVICNHCKHKQETNSKLKRVTCSSCGKKFPREQEKKEIIQKNSMENTTHNNNKEDIKGGTPRVKLD